MTRLGVWSAMIPGAFFCVWIGTYSGREAFAAVVGAGAALALHWWWNREAA